MSELSHAQIGRAFVKKYYTTLHDSPECLYKLYKASSTFVHGGEDCLGEADVAFGPDEIAQKIAEMDFSGCRTRVLQVDSAITLNDGIVIQVCGELSNRGGPMRRFMQTFVLCPLDKKLFYVVNDIFRYNDDVFGNYTPSENRVIMDSARYCITQPDQPMQRGHFSFQSGGDKLDGSSAQSCRNCAAMKVSGSTFGYGVEPAGVTTRVTQTDCKAAMHNTLLCSLSSVVLPGPAYCGCYNARPSDCCQSSTGANLALPSAPDVVVVGGGGGGGCCSNRCIAQHNPSSNTVDKAGNCLPKTNQSQFQLNRDMEFTQSTLDHSYHERSNTAPQNEGCWSSSNLKSSDQPDANSTKYCRNCSSTCDCGRPNPTKPSHNPDPSTHSGNARPANASNPPSAHQNVPEAKPICRNGDWTFSSAGTANSPVANSKQSSYNEQQQQQQHTERFPTDQDLCPTSTALYYPSSSHNYQGNVNCFSGGESFSASAITNNVPPATDQWSQLNETSKEGCFGTTENTDLYRHQLGTSDKSYSKSWAAIASSGRSRTSANSLFQDDDPFFPFNNQADVPYFGNGGGLESGPSLLTNRQGNSVAEPQPSRHRSSIDQSSTASSKGSLASPPTRYPEEYQVFVGNISNATEESSLISLLSKYGKLIEVKLSERSGYDKPKFAFVVFDNTESVDKIISTCSQSPIRLDGKRLNIERRHPSSRASGSKRGTHSAGSLASQFSLGSESPGFSATRRNASSQQTGKASRTAYAQGRSNGGGNGSSAYTKASKQGSNSTSKPSQQHHQQHQQQQHVH